ncbi:MAG: hypothetical protein IKI37_01935 [Oscillospiraceae bacterium]|nr:hypothetical protein [Oscillospiraceae bacterium]MBR7083927.1 hypothetical protein [Oscillospiraceae bacterium]
MTKAELLKKAKELKIDIPPELMQKFHMIDVDENEELSLDSLKNIVGGNQFEDNLLCAGATAEEVLEQILRLLGKT